MANKKYGLRYLSLFEQDLVQTVSYITNVLKNPGAAEKLANDVNAAFSQKTLYTPRHPDDKINPQHIQHQSNNNVNTGILSSQCEQRSE